MRKHWLLLTLGWTRTDCFPSTNSSQSRPSTSPSASYLQQFICFVTKLQGFRVAALWGCADRHSGGQKQHFVCLHEVFPNCCIFNLMLRVTN